MERFIKIIDIRGEQNIINTRYIVRVSEAKNQDVTIHNKWAKIFCYKLTVTEHCVSKNIFADANIESNVRTINSLIE